MVLRITAPMRALSLSAKSAPKPTIAAWTKSAAIRTTPLSFSASFAGKKLQASQPKAIVEVCTEIVAGKLKTRKAAAKRYKITGSGKVMARRPGKQHLNEKYSRNQKKALSRENAVSRSAVKRNVIGALPYAKINKSQNPKCMEREVNKRAAKVAPKWESPVADIN